MEIISVIVPIYNSEQYLEYCVKSIMNQTYRNVEIILIDDGSQDRSGIICDNLSKLDDRIQVIHNENHGVSYSRNCGLVHSKGDYIMFVDSDDWIAADTLECTYSHIISDNSDICFSSKFFKDKLKVCNSTTLPVGKYNYDEILEKHFDGKFISSTCMGLYKSSILKNVRFEEDIAVLEDWLFNVLAIGFAKSISVIDKPLYHYRTNNFSVSQTCLDSKKLTCFRIQDKLKLYESKITLHVKYTNVLAFIINSMAIVFAKSDNSQCKKEAVVLKIEARKILKECLKKRDISKTRRLCVLLCSINPIIFCYFFKIKNRGNV